MKNNDNKKIQDIEDPKPTGTLDLPTGSLSKYESNIDTSFFYTSDKFINNIDNDEIFGKIFEKYNLLNKSDSSDAIVKKQLLELIRNESFVKELLKHYEMNISDFMKLLIHRYSFVFKGPYLKKLKNEIELRKYPI